MSCLRHRPPSPCSSAVLRPQNTWFSCLPPEKRPARIGRHAPRSSGWATRVTPLDRLTTLLRERLSPDTLALAQQGWANVVENAAARGLTLERQATLLFIYEQELCEEP